MSAPYPKNIGEFRNQNSQNHRGAILMAPLVVSSVGNSNGGNGAQSSFAAVENKTTPKGATSGAGG
ncbi:hypothetical protein H5410_003840 [Solanum commersonii]|uniref:Uncharacterized protein n=1 Tax=Solanum commersonii TaxID=4109 RepID=A0A9J6B680_SOLCO|nr:hypothetical protein H5410_003840 [Solanum commersonii]